MKTIHHLFRLQHHKHTGKLLPHQHTSYRGVAFILMVTASSIVGLGILSHVTANAFISIYGTVPVRVPTSPATIAVPTDNTTVTGSTVVVAGSCPLISPQVVISIEVDNTDAGSSVCDSSNNFSASVTVQAGQHTLVARTYTLTGARGPDSIAVHFTYTPPPSTPNQTSTTTQTATTTASPHGLVLSTINPFAYLGRSKTVEWNGTLSGGTSPYTVTFTWDDGTHSTFIAHSGNLHASHTYQSLTSHNITVRVTDATGQQIQRQFAVAAYTSDTPTTGTTSYTSGNGTTPFTLSTIFGLYGLFLSVFAVSGIIWLEARHTRRSTHVAVHNSH